MQSLFKDVDVRHAPKKRILVVDHDFDLVVELRRSLKPTYEVETAMGGGLALLKLQRKPYDLVILDFLLPVLDGAGVLDRMRRLGLHTPVLLMSSLPEMLRSRTAGLRVAGRLDKPFDLKKLKAKIAAILSRKGRGVDIPAPQKYQQRRSGVDKAAAQLHQHWSIAPRRSTTATSWP